MSNRTETGRVWKGWGEREMGRERPVGRGAGRLPGVWGLGPCSCQCNADGHEERVSRAPASRRPHGPGSLLMLHTSRQFPSDLCLPYTRMHRLGNRIIFSSACLRGSFPRGDIIKWQ